MELFQEFLDFMGSDLLCAMEESIARGVISGDKSSTFLALIPKNSSPKDLGDFHPNSLYNFVYKIISMIIATRLKPILSRCILVEQFGFFEKGKIMEAIGVVQEVFHNIKKRNLEAFFLQLDLHKAYDYVQWGFLRLILI